MSNRQLVRYDLGSFQTPVVAANLFCQDYRNAVFEFNSAASSDQVIKFVASNQTVRPDFSSASSNTNQWTYVQAVDLNDGSVVNGTTGVTFAGVTNKSFEVNTNSQQWVGIVVTTGTAGGIYIKANLSDNL